MDELSQIEGRAIDEVTDPSAYILSWRDWPIRRWLMRNRSVFVADLRPLDSGRNFGSFAEEERGSDQGGTPEEFPVWSAR